MRPYMNDTVETGWRGDPRWIHVVCSIGTDEQNADHEEQTAMQMPLTEWLHLLCDFGQVQLVIYASEQHPTSRMPDGVYVLYRSTFEANNALDALRDGKLYTILPTLLPGATGGDAIGAQIIRAARQGVVLTADTNVERDEYGCGPANQPESSELLMWCSNTLMPDLLRGHKGVTVRVVGLRQQQAPGKTLLYRVRCRSTQHAKAWRAYIHKEHTSSQIGLGVIGVSFAVCPFLKAGMWEYHHIRNALLGRNMNNKMSIYRAIAWEQATRTTSNSADSYKLHKAYTMDPCLQASDAPVVVNY